MAECSNSGSCGKSSCEGCASKEKSNPQNFMAEQNVFSDVKHVIGVVSGKGGVGKSFVIRRREPRVHGRFRGGFARGAGGRASHGASHRRRQRESRA